ncbi:MAG: hypothetical protein RBS68_06010 [Anaerolineales bacterium]|jgi:single-stranded DNA-binding protein|nr:hypothetical protein [Anaerolineales bacterium]
MIRNNVHVVADATGDIYYRTTTRDGKPSTPFLRVMVVIQGASSQPGPSLGIRVVAHGRRAEILEAFIQTGTRLDIHGHLNIRNHEGREVVEIVCEHAEAIRYANWDRGYRRIEEIRNQNPDVYVEYSDLIDAMRNKEEEAANSSPDRTALSEPASTKSVLAVP